ncbi:translation initiation factor IF-2 subunit alpha, partial [Candidatus Bathyarchaeota archaeon]|nr:translation initiation factor IF-2 subunit alpha [Candidatus Bathyarchaeota archaeon]
VWIPLEENFGTAYEGLEKATMEGAKPLIEAGLSSRIAEALTKIAKEKIRITNVKVQGILNVSCRKPDGVLRIKKAFAEAEKVKIPNGSSKRIYVVSPPRYRIEVIARDYKTANAIFQKITDAITQGIKRLGGEGKLERG